MAVTSERLIALASDLSYARSSKDAARVRIQVTLSEWRQILPMAKRLYKRREADSTSQFKK